MTTNLQQGTLLDVLKKKMRQTKEEMERYKDECEEFNRKYQLEAMRREEVREIYRFFFLKLAKVTKKKNFQKVQKNFCCCCICREKRNYVTRRKNY